MKTPFQFRLPALALAASLLAACSGTEVHNVNIQTAATGTQIEAKQVVALVYGQKPDAELARLLYSGGDLSAAIRGLRGRYPQLKAWLDQGVVGNTASGFVALRDPARAAELHDLLWDENRDRAYLYNRASAAVGHGGDTLTPWLPYASFTFGQQWIVQGQPGWWALDEAQVWSRR